MEVAKNSCECGENTEDWKFMEEQERTIAMLIDADNVPASKMESAIYEISTFGRIVVKRAYGNWNKATKSWNDDFRKLAIKPVQQIDYVKGKNATDMALAIDAMDFLYTADYDVFVIVSSDSDFTPLAIKLREAGKTVIGIGEKKTSEAFWHTCDDFFYLEDLQESKAETAAKPKAAKDHQRPEEKSQAGETASNELDRMLEIISNTQRYQDDEGYINLGVAGSYVKRVNPDFDIKKYNARSLSEYIEKNKHLYDMKNVKNSQGTTIKFRLKK